ncbi:unnamed protein product [Lupinus luteus]|uniref:Peptidase S8/S53 domain-containing protein n=1 Tax=Lupinus luteus TaxID=3873 RepID=A0AAV1WVH6_LUPLU
MEAMALSEEERLPHNDEGYDLNDDNASLGVVSMDDEGFPSQVHYVIKDATKNRNGERSETVSKKSGFVASFYSCGTDFSSLMLFPEDHRDKDLARDLANLFEIWGFGRNIAVESVSTVSVESKPNQNSGCERMIVRTENRGLILRDIGKVFEKSKPSRKRKDSNCDGKTRVKRACPFYKKMQGTSFTVDAFQYGCVEGCSAYFLSHCHSDHYGGLSKKWSNGPIYCSPLTSCLVQMCLSVNPLYICPLEFNMEHLIDGVKVTLLEANHCPGATLIHFDLPNGQCYLHTRDFRACKQMQAYSLLVNQRVNILYLDTTYCNPKYKFPSKEDNFSGFEAANGKVPSPKHTTRDFIGHGTHTLSTAGGNIVPGAQVFGNENGTSKDEVSIGAFHALANNIVLVASAGNDGPKPETVENAAPWVFIGAASTIDREFTSTLTLGNNDQHKSLPNLISGA